MIGTWTQARRPRLPDGGPSAAPDGRFLLVAGFYLLTEHTAHLWGVLPFLLLLSCPLMHLFHHHGHPKDSTGLPPDPGNP